MDEIVIQKIADILGVASSEIISEYTKYLICQASLLVLLGVGILYKAWTWKPDYKKLEREFFPTPIVCGAKCAALLLGVLFVVNNVPNIVAPKAAAIRQIIQDVR